MMGLSVFTIARRFSSNAFANNEDLALGGPKATLTLADPDVERVRRNHLNDLENIVPFVLVGFFYVATNPDSNVALWHFRVFFASRLLHTISYQVPFPQPTRVLLWGAGFAATISMAVHVLQAITLK
ncbi:unnamed protein product [Didymodactylos carnosus]|uniref:Microsomal glutathione S-transferase 1 n=1 Tax=Didymodactylos carnosus TaxID=1234261 RepID=A0A814IW61_9BILA|nr:unnamed protein product [Didymodactylos carnosus]CAF1157039.1 unnamed protein product [Didymodactylos carnosus]CAF3800949.1 unnamed protein product [Didymodactylos carnosus]CAF3968464.1 unnamed protein product [Didymodactylos carnosus]